MISSVLRAPPLGWETLSGLQIVSEESEDTAPGHPCSAGQKSFKISSNCFLSYIYEGKSFGVGERGKGERERGWRVRERKKEGR